jgi:flagellar hook-basal body complex protein FliE
MVNMNANVAGPLQSIKPGVDPNSPGMPKIGSTDDKKSGFADTIKAAGDYISKVDDLQQSSDMSIKDLLSGKNEDITSVVSAVAKADMSFKLLVGVRNKLIEAYKQTMNMQV